jgi:hypothetical protein
LSERARAWRSRRPAGASVCDCARRLAPLDARAPASDQFCVPNEGKPVRLCVSDADGERCIELGERLVIGRVAGGEGELAVHEPRASRSHAELQRTAQGGYQIRDLESRNGTFVNGQRITGWRDLFHGDQVGIGASRLRLIAPEHVRAAEVAADPLAGGGAAADVPSAAAPQARLVALVASVRSYGSLAEKLQRELLAEFVRGWHRAAAAPAIACGALLDPAGPTEGVLIAEWSVVGDGAREVESALRAARDVLADSRRWSAAFRERFEIDAFQVGVGVHVGAGAAAASGSVAPGASGACGDGAVAIALQLAVRGKDKGHDLLASADVARAAAREWRFEPLGELELAPGEALAVLALADEG